MRVVSALRNLAIIGSLAGLQASLGAKQLEPVAEEAPEQSPDILSFNQDKDARMTVPVSVAGQGPYPFLVDTGAERTVISRELASQLKLGPGKSVTVHSMTDVSQVATAVIPHLAFSKRSMNEIHAPALDAAHLGAAGMLGVDSLKSQRVIFDFGERTMTITPARRHLRDWGPDAIVIKGRSLYGRLVLVDAQVEGQKVLVILDTGSQVSIGNEALKRKLTEKRKLPPTTRINLLSVTGGRLSVDYTSVRRIRLGGIHINDMPIGFADVHPFRQLKLTDRPALLLGMDALRLFDRVSVDFSRRQVRFLPDETRLRQSGGSRLAAEGRKKSAAVG
jgi:predicted aspartyl protease